MTKGGLYIPLPEHIEIFCCTSNFSECHHYINGLALLSEMSAAKVSYEESRRRHRRIKDQLPVSLIRCDDAGHSQADAPHQHAMTVDLSIGGMCLKSSSEIHTNELLLLQLEAKAEQTALSGLADVKWCSPINESSEYLVGLAFRNIETGLAIGRQVGLQ